MSETKKKPAFHLILIHSLVTVAAKCGNALTGNAFDIAFDNFITTARGLAAGHIPADEKELAADQIARTADVVLETGMLDDEQRSRLTHELPLWLEAIRTGTGLHAVLLVAIGDAVTRFKAATTWETKSSACADAASYCEVLSEVLINDDEREETAAALARALGEMASADDDQYLDTESITENREAWINAVRGSKPVAQPEGE